MRRSCTVSGERRASDNLGLQSQLRKLTVSFASVHAPSAVHLKNGQVVFKVKVVLAKGMVVLWEHLMLPVVQHDQTCYDGGCVSASGTRLLRAVGGLLRLDWAAHHRLEFTVYEANAPQGHQPWCPSVFEGERGK